MPPPICPAGQRATPQDCAEIAELGTTYATGITTTGYPAIWDMYRGGPPVYHFDPTQDGAAMAAQTMREWETPEPAPQPAGRPKHSWQWWAARDVPLLIVMIVAYIVIHAHHYSGCIDQPSLFA